MGAIKSLNAVIQVPLKRATARDCGPLQRPLGSGLCHVTKGQEDSPVHSAPAALGTDGSASAF